MRIGNVEVVIDGRALTMQVLKNFRAIKQFEKMAVFAPAKTMQTDEPVHVKLQEENDAAPEGDGVGISHGRGGKGGKRNAKGDESKPKRGRNA